MGDVCESSHLFILIYTVTDAVESASLQGDHDELMRSLKCCYGWWCDEGGPITWLGTGARDVSSSLDAAAADDDGVIEYSETQRHWWRTL